MTINFGRPKIFRLWCASVKRLRRDVGYFPAVVVSDAVDADVCEEFNIEHITQTNHPATAKFNTAVNYLMSIHCRYICVVGSDDVISTMLLKSLILEMDKGIDLIGISTIYFYSAEGKKKGHLKKLEAPKQILGVARTISKKVIDAVGGDLWSRPSSWGMDGICMKTIMPHVTSVKVVDGMAVDVKTSQNLNKFSFWDGKLQTEEDPQEFYNVLSQEELSILQSI